MANKDFNVEIGKSNKEFYPLDKDIVTDTQRGVPKGTPRETLKKLGKYSKNVIVSAGKLTVDVTGSFTPNAASFVQSMTDVVKLASNEAKEKLVKMKEFINKKKSVDTGPKQTMDDFVKSVSNTKRDIIDRLKSGEFYKTDSENIDMSGMFGDADFNFDDFGSDIDLGGSTKFGDPETTLSAEPFGETTTTIPRSKVSGHSHHNLSRNAFSSPTIINMGASSNGGVSLGEELVSNITSDVGKAIISQQNELFDKNFAAAEMRFVQHMEVQKGILQAVNATVNHLQNVEGVSSSAAMEFQGKMIGMQQEQLNLLKEIKEASIIAITPPGNNKTGSQSTTERVLNNGQINAEEYWKNIKSNMNNEMLRSSLGPIYSMLPMLSMMNMGSDMGIKQKADPMSSLLKGVLSASLSMKTKAKLSNLNDMLRDSGSLFLGKMNDLAANSDNKILQTLGRVLGTKDAYVKQGDYGLKDPDKVVGWSAKSDRTLNEVIPTRLSEIVSALTGKEQTFYDYKTGTFVTKTEKNREYQNVRRQAFSDYELDSMTGNMASRTATSKSKGNDKQFIASLNKDFQTIRMNIGKTNRTFNVEAATKNKQYRSELLKGVSNEESLDLFIESFGQMSQNDAVRFNGRTLTVNTTGSRRLQQFSDDALKYGGAGVSSEIQNMDEADALEHRLKNSHRYSEEYLAALDNTPSGKSTKASILREKADIMANIRKLRSGGQSSGNQFVASSIINGGGSADQMKIAKGYQSAVKSAEDSGYITEGNTGNAQNNIYNTLSNMFNLLVNGILVYPQKTDKIPSHITAARKFMSSNAKMSNLARELDNSRYNDLDKAQLEAIESTNESARLSQLTSQFGPFATMAQIFGLVNEDKKDNNVVNRGFNKIYNFAMGKAGVLFGNGNTDISADNNNVNNAYTEYIAKERSEIIKSLKKNIADTEKALSKENASKPSVSFNKKKLDFLKKALKQVENGGELAPEIITKIKEETDPLVSSLKANVTKVKNKIKKPKDDNSKTEAKSFEDVSGALGSAGEAISEKASGFADTIKDAFSQLGLGDKFNKFADKLGTFGTFVTKGPMAAAKRVGGKALSNALSFDSLDDLKGKIVGKIFSSKEVRSKDEILEERKAIQATYAAIDSIEQWCSENLESNDMKADKTINKMINAQVKSGAIDKAIGQMLKDGIANLKAKGYPPIMAFSKVKEAIRAKYDKSFKKEMSAHNPFLKVAKSVGKWSGTVVGSSLLLASGNPLLAVALVGNSLRTNPAFQKFIKNKTDKKSVVHKLNSSLKNKAVGKYGVELSPFDALLGLSPMSKLTDKELENEQKIAAATFTALDEIEKIANETIDPNDKKAGDKVIKMIKAAMKKGPIDKDIGNMIIERITSNIQEGKSPIEALSEAKTTIQKNYSKIFKKESKRRSPGRKILRGFGKGLGIAAVAMYNPLLAAAMLGREILKGKHAKKDKEAGSDRDEINSILGKDALNEKQKKPAGDGFFSRMKDKFTDTATSVKENIQSKFGSSKDKDKDSKKSKESTPSEQKEKGTGIFTKAKNTVTDVFTGLREGSFSDYKADKKSKAKEDREKKQVDLFASIAGTLTSIKKGLGIFDKGEIDEKDRETFAGKLEEIVGATKATSMATGATAEKSSPGFLANIGKTLVKAGNVAPKVATGIAVAGVAITAAAAVHSTAKGIKRWKEEGAAAGVGQLTGLDKAADSDFNADGTRKQGDFHVGGENGFDVDIDRGAERAPAKRQLLNVKSHVKAIKNAGDKVGNGLKNLGNKLIKKGGGEAVESAAKAADSIPPKFITKITDGLKKFFNSKKVAKYIKPEKAKEIISKLTSRFKNSALFKKISAKAGGKSLMKQIPGLGLAMTAVGAAVDFVNGMSKTNRYFKISKSDTATLGMKIAAGLAESIPGLVGAIPGIGLFAGIAAAMIPPDWLAENLYKLFASEKEEAELAAKQEAFQKKADELGVDPDRLNEYENKSLGQKFLGVFKSQEKKDLENARLLGFGDDVEAYKEWEKKYKEHGKGGGTEASSMVEDKAIEAETSIQGTVTDEKASEIKAAVQSTSDTSSATAISPTATVTPTLASTEQQKVEEQKPENLSVNPTTTTEAKRKTSLSDVGKMLFKATPVGLAATAVGAMYKGVKKVGQNIATRIKESPFVTNDKLLMQQLKETLDVQKEIRDEMFRHNETVENFINYMIEYYEKIQKKQKKADQDKMLKDFNEKKAGWFASLFNNKDDSNADDVEFRDDMDTIAAG